MYVYVGVCLFAKKLGKIQILMAQMSYLQTSSYMRNKNNNRCLLKPFGYKVMTVYITQGYEDSWGQLDTSKHNCYCIMAITSKAVHEIKHNRGSPGYNIEQWLQARKLLSSSTYFKSCTVHMIRTCVSIFLFVQNFTGLMTFLSF